MLIKQALGVCVILALSAAAGATVLTEMPPPKTIEMRFRDNAADPQSEVRFTLKLHLTAVASNESRLGWRIDQVELVKAVAGGNPITWSRDNVLVENERDGLWWVDHEVPAEPLSSDFSTAPTLHLVLQPLSSGDGNLILDLAKSGLPHSQEERLFGVSTAFVKFQFLAAGETEPIDCSDDEPVEVDDNDEPN